MNQYKMDSKLFDEMMAKKNYQVVVLNIADGETSTKTYKAGTRQTLEFMSDTINGQEIPNAKVKVSHADVMNEKKITAKVVTFKFSNEIDEKEFLMKKEE